MSTSYKLLYFNIGGRGEVLRVVLRHAGVEFEDKIITFDEWPQYKNNRRFTNYLGYNGICFFYYVFLVILCHLG